MLAGSPCRRPLAALRAIAFCGLAMWLAAAGPAWASYEDGLKAFDGGDFAKAYETWLPLAEAGDARAQHGIGLLYETGRGVDRRSDQEAIKWYRQASAQGLPAALSNMALMFAEGRGVPQDLAQAAALWEQAATAGHPMAQFNLGLMYFGGRGVPRDYRLAARWFAESAAQGLVDAQYAIAEMYRLGHGVNRDLAEARRWYAMAAAAGYPAAAERLAALGGEPPSDAPAREQAAAAPPGDAGQEKAPAEAPAETAARPQQDEPSPREGVAEALEPAGPARTETVAPTPPDALPLDPAPPDPAVSAEMPADETPQPLPPDLPAAIEVAELPAAGGSADAERIGPRSVFPVAPEELAGAGGAPEPIETAPLAAAAEPVLPEEVAVAEAAPAPAPVSEGQEQPRPVAAAEAPSQAAASPSAGATPGEPDGGQEPAEPPAGAPTEVLPQPDRVYRIWLGELEGDREDAARAEWQRLREAYPDLLAERDPLLRRVDLGRGEVLYRILAGPFANRSGAAALCALIEERELGQQCMVVLN